MSFQKLRRDETKITISEKILSEVKLYIDQNYVDTDRQKEPFDDISDNCCPESSKVFEETICECMMPCAPIQNNTLDDMIANMDKGFADTLFYYIDKKGMTDVDCYKRSNVDKKTFSKIKCNKDYKPSKKTAVSFAIGLCLSLEETNHLLSTVGFCLSNSDIFDVIIQYFVSTGNYESIFDVNEVLYQFDQVTLGV